MKCEDEKDAIQDGHMLEAAKCREVVQEIMNFGINQRQLLIIIKLLAMELENNLLMKEVVSMMEERLYHRDIAESTDIIT